MNTALQFYAKMEDGMTTYVKMKNPLSVRGKNRKNMTHRVFQIQKIAP